MNPQLQEIQDLIRQRAEIDSQVLTLKQETKTAAIAEVKALIALHDLRVMDFFPKRPAQRAERRPGEKKSKKPAAIKYIGPVGEKWSGRGMMPVWLRELIEAGATKEQYLIKTVEEEPLV